MDKHLGRSVERLGNGSCSGASGVVGVHEKEYDGCLCQPSELDLGDGGAEQCNDTADSCLGESHCGPRALDDNDCAMSGGKSAVGVIEHFAFWKVGGEAPFAPAGNGVRVEAPAAVADWMALHVVQTHGDCAPKELAFLIGQSGLETCCGLDGDALVLLEERHSGVDWNSTPEGPK